MSIFIQAFQQLTMITASQAIEEFGHLPEKLSKARETHFRQQWAELGV